MTKIHVYTIVHGPYHFRFESLYALSSFRSSLFQISSDVECLIYAVVEGWKNTPYDFRLKLMRTLYSVSLCYGLARFQVSSWKEFIYLVMVYNLDNSCKNSIVPLISRRFTAVSYPDISNMNHGELRFMIKFFIYCIFRFSGLWLDAVTGQFWWEFTVVAMVNRPYLLCLSLDGSLLLQPWWIVHICYVWSIVWRGSMSVPRGLCIIMVDTPYDRYSCLPCSWRLWSPVSVRHQFRCSFFIRGISLEYVRRGSWTVSMRRFLRRKHE